MVTFGAVLHCSPIDVCFARRVQVSMEGGTSAAAGELEKAAGEPERKQRAKL